MHYFVLVVQEGFMWTLWNPGEADLMFQSGRKPVSLPRAVLLLLILLLTGAEFFSMVVSDLSQRHRLQ